MDMTAFVDMPIRGVSFLCANLCAKFVRLAQPLKSSWICRRILMRDRQQAWPDPDFIRSGRRTALAVDYATPEANEPISLRTEIRRSKVCHWWIRNATECGRHLSSSLFSLCSELQGFLEKSKDLAILFTHLEIWRLDSGPVGDLVNGVRI